MQDEDETLRLLILTYEASRDYFWFPRMSGVTIATSLLRSARDFGNLSFHMFPHNEILKVFKCKILLDI